MAVIVETSKELGAALKRQEDTIEIHGDLARQTIRLRATGRVAWAVAAAAIGLAVYAALSAPVTGGTSLALEGFAAPAAIGILGFEVTSIAVAIAVAAGGIGALTSLRQYKELSRTSSSLVLGRR
jgi:hypothetical protein